MIIPRTSDKWNELFGHLDEEWSSMQPPHRAYIDGLVDPSLWPKSSTSAEVLHSLGVTDVHRGAQHMLRVLTTAAESVPAVQASTGIVRGLQQALKDSLSPQSLALELPADLVTATLTNTNHKGRTVATALFATGMSALSTAGPIGMAAAAIIGFAFAVFNAVERAKQWKETEKKERMRRAYELMPPLQEPGDDSDQWYVRTRVFPVLQRGDWTRLFAPRFDPRKEWVGAPRNGGYGFAPGDVLKNKDEFGIDVGEFSSADNVGYLPGFNRITSVVQVSLNPMGDDIEYWYEHGGRWPIKKAMVRDVGDFYVNTTRMCSIVWAWATEQDASPNLYKLHVGTPELDDDGCLHAMWRLYFAGGLDYILENSRQWAEWHTRGLRPGGRVKDPEHREFLFGSAIGCAVSSWACYRHSSSTTNDLRLYRTPPGYPPAAIKINHGLPGGCVIEPSAGLLRPRVDISGKPVDDDRLCLVSLYESHVKTTLEKVRARQEHFLRRSLVCAYVRKSWDAFKDPTLSDELDRLRTKLLTHPDRKLIDLRDVPDGEVLVTSDGAKDWKQLLRDSGVKSTPIAAVGFKGVAPTSGSIEPADEPAPTVPKFGSMPFAAAPVPSVSWWRRPQVLGAAAVAATLGGGALAYALRNRRGVRR